MIAVADASPVCYLILIGDIELLPKLFERVLLPREVLNELRAEAAPALVRSWAANLPSWITVEDGAGENNLRLDGLQEGEKAVIRIAQSKTADLVLLDDKAARQAAREIGLLVTGLLGLMREAATLGLVDLPVAIEKLTRTSFRCSPVLLRSVLADFQADVE